MNAAIVKTTPMTAAQKPKASTDSELPLPTFKEILVNA